MVFYYFPSVFPKFFALFLTCQLVQEILNIVLLLQYSYISIKYRFLAIHTAGNVENIKNEVDKLEKLLVSRGEIYKKIKEWKELWTEKINYESSANDKMRYHNRGGQLQIALQVFHFFTVCNFFN